MTTVQIALLVILGFCILASGYLSGSETALVAIPRERVLQLAANGSRGRHLTELTANPERMLGTLLLANNFVNILAASVGTVLAIDLVGESAGPWVATLAITAIILVVGEITPKTLATRRPEQFALTVATPIWFLQKVLSPLAGVFLAVSRVILRWFGLTTDDRAHITEDDIRAMAALSERAGYIDPEEREIIEHVFSLADRPVREVMTPRGDVVAVEEPVDIETVRRLVAVTGHSRYLIRSRGGSLDNPAGVLYVKDLLRSGRGLAPADIERLIRQPIYIPESSSILDALQDMRQRKIGFAVVVDEHGGVEGLITIKDLVGELVGSLRDEYDPGTPVTVPLGQNMWIADGRVDTEDLGDVLGIALPDGPFSTVAGLFMAISGSIPTEGDQVHVDAGVRLTVIGMDRQRIDRLRVELTVEPQPQLLE